MTDNPPSPGPHPEQPPHQPMPEHSAGHPQPHGAPPYGQGWPPAQGGMVQPGGVAGLGRFAGPGGYTGPGGYAGPGGFVGHPGPDPTTPHPGLLFGSSYRTPRARWWKGLLSIIIVLAAVLIVSTVFGLVATFVDIALGNQDPDLLLEGQLSMTPLMLAATNLSLVAAGAVSIIAHRWVSGVRMGFFHSVLPGFRWRWLWLSAAIVSPVYILFAASSFLDPMYQELAFNGTTLVFLLIIVFTTPLQAAAEEYMFRGVIQRAAGSWVKSSLWSMVVGTTVSAILFSAAHFAADLWLIGYYLLFGVGLSILAQRTGGLEASIAIHTANNVFLLIVATLAGQMDAGFDRSAGTGGPIMILPVVILGLLVLLLSWIAKRQKLALVTSVPESATSAPAAAAVAPAPPAAPPWSPGHPPHPGMPGHPPRPGMPTGE